MALTKAVSSIPSSQAGNLLSSTLAQQYSVVSYNRPTMAHQPLQGSCLCGRNEYTIQIPDDVADHAQIYFDTSRDSR